MTAVEVNVDVKTTSQTNVHFTLLLLPLVSIVFEMTFFLSYTNIKSDATILSLSSNDAEIIVHGITLTMSKLE